MEDFKAWEDEMYSWVPEQDYTMVDIINAMDHFTILDAVILIEKATRLAKGDIDLPLPPRPDEMRRSDGNSNASEPR